ncbi:MetQ/NlpA family ABC transporter substrate-binding protein [Aerococcus suis]|uniref:Lipoprotein n=1 Tax=Aerococcus suis TaxID=371602 RepID=A0A1W1YJ69_9LACT|nr:MetQ/NlpA family ABC transporter substrate-binding protein [Aerococcus suis]MCI7240329.1 MetQ/NlpA family ABC transporter substrate-binding protein [Aerococcus suis]MDD7759038.1 MetQ/NlpA family ABC transporter substrate-binding protein [Aerococcus suis]MDY4646087.1 MetQ/NlpA family ABC transporter substrate-binding protein [Aerococcus suis]SMC36219.1 D-methionine transport system substrate-binding protein [Aerococcus suis]
MKKWVKFGGAVLFSLVLGACSNQNSEGENTADDATHKVGVVGDVEREVWEDVADRLKDKEGIDLEVVVFDDYVQPNNGLSDGSLDLNAFQHLAFLNDYVSGSDKEITPVGYTYVSPMAAYANDLDDINEIKENAKVIIPNDATNSGRALLLLESAGLIEVNDDAGITPSVDDIEKNDKNLDIEEVDAAQVPRSLDDADVVIANTNYAVDFGLNPHDDGIYVDTDDLSQVGAQYKCVIAVQPEDKDADWVKKVVAEYQSPETEEKIKEVTDGADDKAWSDNDNIAEDFAKIQENN